ncbi:hypothetical protein CapIbe_000256 [Capra ibex]
MRTYWLHSVWVLGFFLSLFSLQALKTRQSLILPPETPAEQDTQREWTSLLSIAKISILFSAASVWSLTPVLKH